MTVSIIDQVLGASITIFGVSITVVGLNGMKWFQIRTPDGKPWHMSRKDFWRWFFTLCLWGAGQLCMLSAVNFATESVCAATANVALIVNAAVASYLFGEPFHLLPTQQSTLLGAILSWDLAAVIIMIVGAALVVVSAPPILEKKWTIAQQFQLVKDPIFVIVFLVSIGFVFFLSVFLVGTRRSSSTRTRRIRGVAFGITSGICGGCCYTATKLVFNVIDDSKSWNSPAFYVVWLIVGIFELLNIVSLNMGMYSAEASTVVPCYYIGMTIFSALQDLSLFKLFGEFTKRSASEFIVGVSLCVYGVFVISYRDEQPNDEEQLNEDLLLPADKQDKQ